LLLAAFAVLDAQAASQVENDGNSRVRDDAKVDQLPTSIMKSGHGDSRQAPRTDGHGDIPDSRTGAN
jgi:hypothetical protein